MWSIQRRKVSVCCDCREQNVRLAPLHFPDTGCPDVHVDLPTADQTASTYYTLLTVLFSYAYDARTTQHDPTSESGWTISILTPAFSALDPAPYKTPLSPAILPPVPSEIAAVFVASYRRSLAFPLYRSYVLAEACRADVATFLEKGKRVVLRCLLEVKKILDHHDVYYVYSKIWMDDLCVWIQSHARCVSLPFVLHSFRLG